MEVKSFRDLKVWQLAMDLSVDIYQVTQGFPREEMYGLTNQLRRASGSVAFNIAEGSSRRSTAEFIRFVNISCGSLAELQCQLLLANRLQFLADGSLKALYEKTESISRMLNALHRSLSERDKTPKLLDSKTPA